MILALVWLVGGAYLLRDSTPSESEQVDSEPPAVTRENRTLEPERELESDALPDEASGAEPALTRFTIASEAVGKDLPVSVIEPAETAAGDRPLLVFLHGAGGSDQTSVSDPGLHEALAEVGERAPVIAFPDGEMSWWRDRADGDWGRYVAREVIPAVARRFDADPRRVAVGGISMGGYGAYHLGLTYPRRFCAVGGHSAGLYLDFEEASFGAFDSPEDFRHNDIVSIAERNPNAFGETVIWNDYGDRDWFVEGNAAFVEALEQGGTKIEAHVWPGGHDGLYWSEHWPDYLRFYSRALAECRP